MRILFLLLLALQLVAADSYSLRAFGGVATDYDFGEILTGDIGKFQPYSGVYALDFGYTLADDLKSHSWNIYLQSGLSYYEQHPSQHPIYELTLYIKVYYNIDFLDNRVRIGAGEGASYTSGILQVEREDAQAYGDNNSHILNYLDVSLDFDLGRLVRSQALEELYVGVLIKHRSGIFGLINNVRHGGSNHVGFYLEKNF